MGSGQSTTKLTANQRLEQRKNASLKGPRANPIVNQSGSSSNINTKIKPQTLKNEAKEMVITPYSYRRSSIEPNLGIANESSDKNIQRNKKLEKRKATAPGIELVQKSNTIVPKYQSSRFDMDKFKKANIIEEKKEFTSYQSHVDHTGVVDDSILDDNDEDLMNEILGGEKLIFPQ